MNNFTGLNNLGSTCMMNCVVQIIDKVPTVRNAILKSLATEVQPILLNLQSLLYQLEKRQDNISCEDLLDALGVTLEEAQTQHEDFEEVFTSFIDRIDEELSAENKMSALCDVRPAVKDRHDAITASWNISVSDSFENSVGQSDFKGYNFEQFPPVLSVRLNWNEEGQKILKPMTFPESFILNETTHRYHLKCIVMHNGNVKKGHNWLYVHNILENDWFIFNDSQVAIIPREDVFRKASGTDREAPTTSAYCLLYLREDQIYVKNEEHKIDDVDFYPLIYQCGKYLKNPDEEFKELLKSTSKIAPQNLFANYNFRLTNQGVKPRSKNLRQKFENYKNKKERDELPSIKKAKTADDNLIGSLTANMIDPYIAKTDDYKLIEFMNANMTDPNVKDINQKIARFLSSKHVSEQDIFEQPSEKLNYFISICGKEDGTTDFELCVRLAQLYSAENIRKFMKDQSQNILISKRVTDIASDLASKDSLSMLFRPTYCEDYTFLGHEGVNKFLRTQKDRASSAELQDIVYDLKSTLNFYPSCFYDTNSETSLIMPNLQSLLSIITNKIGIDKPSVQNLVDKGATQYEHVFARWSSKSEEGIRMDNSSIAFFTCGSEGKGAGAALFQSLSQGVQSGSDVLFHLTRRLRCRTETTVVPVILIAGEHIQIMLVYSLQEFYPIPLLVSKELNYVRDSPDLDEIASWILAIIDNSKSIWSAIDPTAGFQRHEEVICCNPSNFFLKPVQVLLESDAPLKYYARLSALIEIYRRLFANEEAKKFTVFPCGFLAYPSQDISWTRDIIRVLDRTIEEKLWRLGVGPYNPASTINPKKNRPIRIYPNLLNGPACYLNSVSGNDLKVPPEHIQSFYDEIKKACSILKSLGICHYDLRLENILYRLNASNEIEIKIIDWDYADFFGRKVSEQLKTLQTITTLNYPSFDTACEGWYDHYLKLIASRLGVQE